MELNIPKRELFFSRTMGGIIRADTRFDKPEDYVESIQQNPLDAVSTEGAVSDAAELVGPAVFLASDSAS